MVRVADPLLCGGMEINTLDEEELKIAIYINDPITEKMELLKDIESIIPPGLQIESDSALIQNSGGELINNLAKESVYSSRLDFFKKDDTAKEIAEQQKKIQDLIAIEHSYSIKK